MFFLTDVSLEVTWNYQNSHFSEHLLKIEPANIYMLQVNKISERHQWRRSRAFIANFDYISQILWYYHSDFVQVNAGWAFCLQSKKGS